MTFYIGTSKKSIFIGNNKFVLPKGFQVIQFQPPEPEITDQTAIADLSSERFVKTGTWLNSSLLGYNETTTMYTNSAGATAEWGIYAEANRNYNIFVWIPSGGSESVDYFITTSEGIWKTTINQAQNANKWLRLATVVATSGTVISVLLTASGMNTRINAVKFETTNDTADRPYGSSDNQDTTTVAIFVNQSGYNVDGPKRATITNLENGTPFYVKKNSDNTVVHSGEVISQIADFTDFTPDITEEYFLECAGKVSYPFLIGKYIIQRVSIDPALKFMIESREDGFEKDWEKGYGWRDSHQFSFELNSLVLQYMANPSAYERMPYGITHLDVTEYPELAVQNEPDIIWLMKFAALRYYDFKINHGYHLHSLIKEQLAYFLYIYPEISQYVSQSFYEKIRDFTIAEWTNPNCTLSWYETTQTYSHNLLIPQSVIGDIKGMLPPAHAVMPNLMMYEVTKRDGIANYQDYFDAAYNNALWVINEVDLDNPDYTKGQRMSEHITMENLAYFQEMHPSQAPVGLIEKINRWADVMISRSNNVWDLRKHSDPNDITAYTLDQWTGGGNQYNEPGNVAGFMAPAYAAKRVLTDENKKRRIQEIAIAQIDNVFGRNPFGRHYSYKATSEIEGADTNWFVRMNGFGELTNVPGALDGSPKEMSYPFKPDEHYGYSEGWVAFNTAWNASLAYEAADHTEIKVYDSSFTNEINTATVGETIGIKLKAPLNFDETAIETGEVEVTLSNGIKNKITVAEMGSDDYYFGSTFTIPTNTTHIDVSYGIGIFKKTKRITIN